MNRRGTKEFYFCIMTYDYVPQIGCFGVFQWGYLGVPQWGCLGILRTQICIYTEFKSFRNFHDAIYESTVAKAIASVQAHGRKNSGPARKTGYFGC